MSIPVVIILGLLLYFASQIGQRLGGSQMDHLREVIDELIR
jgi:hypothetical protein